MQENAQLVLNHPNVQASSITFYPGDFPEVSSGSHPIYFKVDDFEFRMIVEDTSVNGECEILLQEIATQGDVIDKRLDIFNPYNKPFQVLSRDWYRRKKKKDDVIDPKATLLAGERILKRLDLLKRLKHLMAK